MSDDLNQLRQMRDSSYGSLCHYIYRLGMADPNFSGANQQQLLAGELQRYVDLAVTVKVRELVESEDFYTLMVRSAAKVEK